MVETTNDNVKRTEALLKRLQELWSVGSVSIEEAKKDSPKFLIKEGDFIITLPPWHKLPVIFFPGMPRRSGSVFPKLRLPADGDIAERFLGLLGEWMNIEAQREADKPKTPREVVKVKVQKARLMPE